MGLKRRVKKTYSVDEMLAILNKDFTKHGRNADSYDPTYSISTTCFEDDKQRFMLIDSRTDRHTVEDKPITDELKPFYGSTILEAITQAFSYRQKHG
tara:strand:+ start:3529 stop:3819 length:291 start_codon:yes stop_codon:yes gene_type:complete